MASDRLDPSGTRTKCSRMCHQPRQIGESSRSSCVQLSTWHLMVLMTPRKNITACATHLFESFSPLTASSVVTSGFLQFSASERFDRCCLCVTHCSVETWLEKITVHGCYWSPRQAFTPFLRHVVMSATSAHHAVCALIAERHVCCFVFFPFSCSRFVSGACSHSPVCCSCFSLSFNSSFIIVCHRILTFFQTVQLLLCTTFLTLTAALRPWSYKFVTLEPLTVLAS